MVGSKKCECYENLAGGIKVSEPAIDLGIVMAIASSFKNRAVPDGMLAFGEVGLSGEVRSVSMAQTRVKEAAKLGFHTCIVPAVCVQAIGQVPGMKIIGVSSVSEAIDVI